MKANPASRVFAPRRVFLGLAVFAFVSIILLRDDLALVARRRTPIKYAKGSYDWATHARKHPIAEADMARLPTGSPLPMPAIQHDFHASLGGILKRDGGIQLARKQAVKAAFQRAWTAYAGHAWGHDEIQPLSMRAKDPFSGWGATMVDSLDTLWMMGMKREFYAAVAHVATIDWNNSTSERCNLFETNIRYLGGLLAAYEVSQEKVLLDKAAELGEMLYVAFDTPNHFPPFTFAFKDLRDGEIMADPYQSAAAIGTLSLEFTRLAQLTGNFKFYDAIDRIKRALDRVQQSTLLPGLWPNFINVRDDFKVQNNIFRLGADGDSLYEYLPKMHILLGGLDTTYEKLYRSAMDTARAYLLFRPMIQGDDDILLMGSAIVGNNNFVQFVPEMEHLTCFAGGMFALAGRALGIDGDVAVGEKLARGCAWAYGATASRIMPERAQFLKCDGGLDAPCPWDEARWRERTDGATPRPFRFVEDRRYLLRPEAIESLFVLYRITGKADLLDLAWDMFRAVERGTRTERAYAQVSNVLAAEPGRDDSMESFFLAETLKYFYLIFSDPGYFSLDEWVFNTEAHPFRRPTAG